MACPWLLTTIYSPSAKERTACRGGALPWRDKDEQLLWLLLHGSCLSVGCPLCVSVGPEFNAWLNPCRVSDPPINMPPNNNRMAVEQLISWELQPSDVCTVAQIVHWLPGCISPTRLVEYLESLGPVHRGGRHRYALSGNHALVACPWLLLTSYSQPVSKGAHFLIKIKVSIIHYCVYDSSR